MRVASATHAWFYAHRLQGARVQSPGVCTHSVMSTAGIRSNLILKSALPSNGVLKCSECNCN